MTEHQRQPRQTGAGPIMSRRDWITLIVVIVAGAILLNWTGAADIILGR